ncbi:hypothetical protein [Kitasatospora sp. NPDC056531]|uniref:hypothetical protein n=1 Tax=Kitasatospora sp. NPDC056531 TaxID=3345856 RepID=UPI00368C7446
MPSWATSTPLFHETDASAQAAAPGLPEVVREDLAEAGRWLAPLTVRHPLYDEMVRWFVRRHGPGAGGVDLLGFLYSFLEVADLAALARRTPGPHPGEGGADRLRGHGTLGHAGHAVFFQIAAADAARIADGEYDMIVNLVHSGATGLLSRWTGVPAVHDRLAEPLTDWVRQRHPGCTVYQVAAHGDWLDLQRPTLRTLPRLRCPGDLADPGADADLAELALAHDPATGTLQASGRDGAPVAFSYLGTVPQYLLTGPVQLLCLLSDPWISMGRVDRDRRVLDDGDSAGVTVLPQLRQGRIVWARKRWSFSPEDLPQPRHRQAPVEFLAEVDRWRSRHGLPDEVFVTQIVRRPTGAEKDKPQWLGFDHPHSIWAVLGHLRVDAARIDVAEALPHRGHHWADGPDGRPVATEFLGLVSHA